jgi:hypothetical protein
MTFRFETVSQSARADADTIDPSLGVRRDPENLAHIARQFEQMTPAEYQAWKAEQAAAKRKRWPTEAERASMRWTEQHDRPTAATYPYALPTLAQVQQIWDEAEAKRRIHVEAVEALAADRKAREAAQQAEHDRRRAEYVAAEDAKQVGEWRWRFFASDPTATEQDFQAALPEIRRQHRLDAAMGRTSAGEIGSLINQRSF